MTTRVGPIATWAKEAAASAAAEPQAPGSATDTVARILAAELGPQLGQTIIVENRPGGALTIGIDIVAKSPPDGYTLGVGPIGALAITRHMVARLPYNIERDLQPIALVTRGLSGDDAPDPPVQLPANTLWPAPIRSASTLSGLLGEPIRAKNRG